MAKLIGIFIPPDNSKVTQDTGYVPTNYNKQYNRESMKPWTIYSNLKVIIVLIPTRKTDLNPMPLFPI